MMTKIKITVVKGFTAEEVFGGDVPDYFPENFVSPFFEVSSIKMKLQRRDYDFPDFVCKLF